MGRGNHCRASAPRTVNVANRSLLLLPCADGCRGVTKSFVELTPSLQMNSSGFMPTALWYDNAQLESAVALMLQAADDMRRGPAVRRERFEYDVIDFTKQWMSNLLIDYHAQLVGAYNRQDNTSLSTVGRTILSLLEDWDALLNTNVHFLLGTWIRDARQWGATVDEQHWLEWNARNQITLWGPDGQIADYASKVHNTHSLTAPLTQPGRSTSIQHPPCVTCLSVCWCDQQWGGLLSGYYLPRWRLFIDSLAAAVVGGSQWNEAAFDRVTRAGEQQWQHTREKYPTTPQGDTVMYARYITTRYKGGMLL